jgi:hypothetical protein
MASPVIFIKEFSPGKRGEEPPKKRRKIQRFFLKGCPMVIYKESGKISTLNVRVFGRWWGGG